MLWMQGWEQEDSSKMTEQSSTRASLLSTNRHPPNAVLLKFEPKILDADVREVNLLLRLVSEGKVAVEELLQTCREKHPFPLHSQGQEGLRSLWHRERLPRAEPGRMKVSGFFYRQDEWPLFNPRPILYSTFPRHNSVHDIQKQTQRISSNFCFSSPLWAPRPSPTRCASTFLQAVPEAPVPQNQNRPSVKFLRLRLDWLSLLGQKCPGESDPDYATNHSLRKLKMLRPRNRNRTQIDSP